MSKTELSRRGFLKVMASGTAGAIAASAMPLAAAPAQQGMYNEAPMLADLVASGDLPPVAERLPNDPRVITPLSEVGQYGGTWRRAFKGISDRWGPTKLNEEMAIEWDAPDPDTINIIANYISGWTQNDDASEYTFTLREGLKWSDGHPYTTEAVQFWYDEGYLPDDISGKEDYYTVGGVDMELEVIDELTWTVRFPAPNPLMPIAIAKRTGGSHTGGTMAAPGHYLREFMPQYTSDQSKIDAAMETNGMATWQELFGNRNWQGPIGFWFLNPELPTIMAWRTLVGPINDPYIMERNPYYHAVDTEGNQLPYIDQIEHALFDDNSVFDLWIAEGRIDLQGRHVSAANFTFYKENEETGDYKVNVWKAASTNALHPNTSHLDPVLRELFSDARFREALSISINREEINGLIYDGLLEPRQASPVSGSPNYDPEFETRWTEYDPDAAMALLDEIGLETGSDGIRLRSDGEQLSFQILHRNVTGTPGADEINLIETYWRAIGLGVSQDLVERSLYEARMDTGEVDVGVWGADRNSVVMSDTGRYLGTIDDGPWAPLFGHWYANSLTGTQEEPPADHPIREIWSLWEQVQAEPDEATRNALFTDLLNIHKEAPYMIGTVGEAPALKITSNNMRNFAAGYISDDTLRDIGLLNPAQYWLDMS